MRPFLLHQSLEQLLIYARSNVLKMIVVLSVRATYLTVMPTVLNIKYNAFYRWRENKDYYYYYYFYYYEKEKYRIRLKEGLEPEF